MCVIIQSPQDQSIHYPILCKNNQPFNYLENLLYEKYPEYKETQNYFVAHSIKINKYQTLDENRIRDGEIIFFNVKEESEI